MNKTDLEIERILKEFKKRNSEHEFDYLLYEEDLAFSEMDPDRVEFFLSQALHRVVRKRDKEIYNQVTKIIDKETDYVRKHPTTKIEDVRYISGMITLLIALESLSHSEDKGGKE